jgi:invasion protein IalB
MKVGIATASTRPGARAWAVALVTAMLTTTTGWSVFAQAPPPAQPAPKAQPKAQPKAAPQQAPAAPAPAAPAPAAGAKPGGGPEVPPLTYTQWTKVCFTGKEGRIDTGMLVIGAVLIEPEGAPNKVLRVTLPLGMQLPPGTRAIVDGGQPMTAPYLVCFPNGCMADYEASTELVGKLKQGKSLVVQAINSQGQGISLAVPLPDFAKAYDGPPTDPKIVEDRQKKLEEEFIKKQQALQQQQQQAAPK